MKKQIKELLRSIKQPTKAKYTVVHDGAGQKPFKPINGIHYKIVCETPQKACPLTMDQVLKLDNAQAAELMEYLQYRKLKKSMDKRAISYFKNIIG